MYRCKQNFLYPNGNTRLLFYISVYNAVVTQQQTSNLFERFSGFLLNGVFILYEINADGSELSRHNSMTRMTGAQRLIWLIILCFLWSWIEIG